MNLALQTHPPGPKNLTLHYCTRSCKAHMVKRLRLNFNTKQEKKEATLFVALCIQLCSEDEQPKKKTRGRVTTARVPPVIVQCLWSLPPDDERQYNKSLRAFREFERVRHLGPRKVGDRCENPRACKGKASEDPPDARHRKQKRVESSRVSRRRHLMDVSFPEEKKKRKEVWRRNLSGMEGKKRY